jgi:hypothetical protein
MTPQELQEFQNLKKEVADLKSLFYKDNYSDLEVFRKKVEFKSDVKLANIDTLTKTGGTNVIADGNTTINIGAGGGSITITTKNGIITAIT